MITLNDYLYSGDTILRILHNYIHDLRAEAKKTHNEVDMIHCNFLILIKELLEHNDFLTAQSQQIREFYKYMSREYPFLAFTFKGRIKSLIRAEEKFNGYVVEYIYDYYTEHGEYPPLADLKNRLSCFRDFIAYRIVISMPRCHLKSEADREQEELKYLYQIANVLPGFLGGKRIYSRIGTWSQKKRLTASERGCQTLLQRLYPWNRFRWISVFTYYVL